MDDRKLSAFLVFILVSSALLLYILEKDRPWGVATDGIFELHTRIDNLEFRLKTLERQQSFPWPEAQSKTPYIVQSPPLIGHNNESEGVFSGILTKEQRRKSCCPEGNSL